MLAALQAFIKTVNYQHIMPTRYTLDADLKTIASGEALENSTKKVEARKVSSRLLCLRPGRGEGNCTRRAATQRV